MDIFLRAKHWQLFSVVFGVPIIFTFIMIGLMFSTMISQSPSDITFISEFMIYMLIVMAISVSGLYAWMWSIGVVLQKKIPENIRLKTTLFKVFLILPLIYYIFFAIYFYNLFIGSLITNPHPIQMLVIMPFHFFAMFCSIYCLYFIAKTFKTAELQREVKVSDYIGEFFIFWFYPIGIWFIQPRINQLVEGNMGEQA